MLDIARFKVLSRPVRHRKLRARLWRWIKNGHQQDVLQQDVLRWPLSAKTCREHPQQKRMGRRQRECPMDGKIEYLASPFNAARGCLTAHVRSQSSNTL
jgi:hypothetical protein